MAELRPFDKLPRGAGRPSRVSIDRIVDAAREIGLDKLEMVKVARRLNIGVATLYGYVSSRDELLKLVAMAEVDSSGISDRGQTWQDAMREHAAILFDRYSGCPRLLTMLTEGMIGPGTEAEYLDGLFRILLARGFSPEQAVALFGEVTMLVIGAASGAVYAAALDRQSEDFQTQLSQMLLERPAEDLPALRQCAAWRSDASIHSNYRPALEAILADERWLTTNENRETGE